MRFTVGVDLAQTFDYTAIAILEETEDHRFEVRHLERHRNRPYPVIVKRIGSLAGRLPDRPMLAVDATGVGRPIIDMIREARINADLRAITLTGGDAVTQDGFEFRVPKRDVVSTVAVLLQTGRLRIASGLKDAPILDRELRRFRAKITLAGNDTYEAWRENDHDDLVLAVALAAWVAEKGKNGVFEYYRRIHEDNVGRARV